MPFNLDRNRIAILGSTGSIGCNALEVVAHLGPPFRAAALSAHQQVAKLVEQARRHRPAAVGIGDDAQFAALKAAMNGTGAAVYAGQAGLAEMVAREDVDTVLAAIVGAAGLRPVFAAVRANKKLALANKESLVVAGSLLIAEAKQRGVPILPVDSEHSAVFQAMQCGRTEEVRRVILTASGGPFRATPLEQVHNATVEDALRHPTWRMGAKITIDSATMFNKALEIIEACWLWHRDLLCGRAGASARLMIRTEAQAAGRERSLERLTEALRDCREAWLAIQGSVSPRLTVEVLLGRLTGLAA